MGDRRLQVFHAVAKQMSFTRAAEVLFMTQPAVTFQIKQLEEYLNTRLFDRGHGKISLTLAGEMVLEYAERILSLAGEMEMRVSEMTGEVRGSLLVGSSTTIAEFMLPRILGEFKSTYPEVRQRLVVANSEAIQQRVSEHMLDIGLIESPPKQGALDVEVCSEDELQVVCAPDFPLAKLKEVLPAQLLEHSFISRELGSGTREYTDNYLRENGINPEHMKLVMELGGPEALNGVVESGLGFSIVSRASVVKAKRLGDLVTIPLKPRLMRTLYMVYPKEKFRSRLVTTFVEFAAKRMRENAAKLIKD
jgi:DNA-binding transcriptional LysR family regulator